MLNAGYVPLVREHIEQALRTLRHEQIEAVLVDARNAGVDALEFVLNVRDVDRIVPILVATSDETPEDLRPALQGVPGVRLTEPDASPEKAVTGLERIVRASETRS